MTTSAADLAQYPWRPKTSLVDVCSVCPHRCVYCHHQRWQTGTNAVMPTPMFKQIIDIMKAEGFSRAIVYQAGESFAHPDIYELLEHVADSGMTTEIASKLAVSVDWARIDAMCDVFKSHGKQLRIVYEVDSLEKETALKIAGRINISQQKQNLQTLGAMVQRRGEQRRSDTPGLYTTGASIVTAWNEHELAALQKQITSYGLPHWQPKQMGLYKIGAMTEEQHEEALTALPTNRTWRARVTTKQIDGKTRLVSNRGGCRHARRPSISPHGNVTICCHDMNYELELGNVVEVGSLLEIVNSDLYQTTRERGGRRQLSICDGCN